MTLWATRRIGLVLFFLFCSTPACNDVSRAGLNDDARGAAADDGGAIPPPNSDQGQLPQTDGQQACSGIVCGPHAHCDPPSGSCVCDDGSYGDPALGCTVVDPVMNWIGSPCQSVADCGYTAAQCLAQSQGYPGGHCTLDCSKTCPDQSGTPITFCIEPLAPSGGHCFAKCDFEIYPLSAGCRPHYTCTPWARVNTSTMDFVCVPEAWVVKDPCADPANLAGNDDCYLQQISYGDTDVRLAAEKLLKGTASNADALQFLDRNYELSQLFIKNTLGVTTIHDNFTAGHSSTSPMRGMIVHYTAAQREEGTIKYFVGASPHASSHFISGSFRNGLIVQLFSHKNRTWHAGTKYNIDRFGFDFANAGYLEPSAAGGFEDYAGQPYTMVLPLLGKSPVTIKDGIPGGLKKYGNRDNWQPYTYYQLLSFIVVSRALHKVYNLQSDAIQRHGDVEDSRVDPGPALATTFLKAMIFNNDDVFSTTWLKDYKKDGQWIVKNPQAR
jgi:N-acetyl-anhydromuramyl-L-alanine amidase AmpD